MKKFAFLAVFCFVLFTMLSFSAAAQLNIASVDVSSPGKASEVKPNELVTISFELENEGDDKIENVGATVYFDRNGKKLKYDNGDEIKFEFDNEIDYIRGGKSKQIEFSFNIPFDVDDNTEYAVVVEADGRNASNREKFNVTDRSETFSVVKDRHDIIFYKLDISPTTMSCDRNLNVHYDLRNIGYRDEDANLTIINNLFSINVTESFSLEKDYDEDNKWEKSHTFAIPMGVAPGTYGFTINLDYGDGNKHQYNTTQLTIQDCNGQSSSGTTQPATPATTGTTGTTTTTTAGQQPNVNVQYTQPSSASYPAVAPNKSGETSMTTILIAAAAIIVFLLVILIALMMRKR